jgi:undecaprenyl-diphosphatase
MHTFVTLIAKYLVAVPVLVMAVVFCRLDKKQRLQFVLFAGLSCIIAVVLVKLATTMHQDPRPFVRDGVHPYFASSTDNGFPSDHTAFSSLIAFVVMKYRRRTGIALLLTALLIGVVRVVAGVHHGQDIAGGLVIAGISVACAYGILHVAHIGTPGKD